MLPINQPNHQIPRLIIRFCRNLQQHWVVPKFLGFDKINAVLRAIGLALVDVKPPADLNF
jgi:hypothetical protein